MGKSEHRKRIVIMIYLSIVIHFYILLIGSFLFENRLKDLILGKPELSQRETSIENIIIHTVVSGETPEEGLISENPNPDSSEELAENEMEYNYLNPEMSPVEGEGEEAEAQGVNEAQSPLSEESLSIPEPEDFEVANVNSLYQPLPEGEENPAENSGGDPTTTFYDPEEEMVIRMNSRGRISVATIPEDYAEYFQNMGNTIAETWRTFFPQFQYYLGILKSGDIQIFIQLDQEGNVVKTEVLESFGYGVLDESLRNAVVYSGSFGPLPEDLPADFSSELTPEEAGRGEIAIIFQYVFVAENTRDDTLNRSQ